MLISEFARLGQVSVRMLRHYDAVGLLTPDHTDADSGYRSYSPDQLPALNRIVALKDLGFTLSQVGRLLQDDVDVASRAACSACAGPSWRTKHRPSKPA